MDTARPAGVTARYLTAVGAHVDISPIEHSTSHSVICGGCEYESVLTGAGLSGYDTAEYVTQRTGQDARRWAQTHAGTCRALPKP